MEEIPRWKQIECNDKTSLALPVYARAIYGRIGIEDKTMEYKASQSHSGEEIKHEMPGVFGSCRIERVFESEW